MQSCGLTPEELANFKVKCQYCGGLYRKSSIQTHEQGFCPVRRAMEAKENPPVQEKPKPKTADDVLLSNTGRIKRKTVKNE